MRSERHDILAKIALGSTLAGVVLFIIVAIMAVSSPANWTMKDASNLMMAAETGSFFLAALAYRTAVGKSAMVISAVLALGCYLFTP
ncbi:MAG: hypothetical protein H0W83_16605 [Planctomycetes bacterium]|nr:hypothetical protein [Planctomycetota bacterium]